MAGIVLLTSTAQNWIGCQRLPKSFLQPETKLIWARSRHPCGEHSGGQAAEMAEPLSAGFRYRIFPNNRCHAQTGKQLPPVTRWKGTPLLPILFDFRISCSAGMNRPQGWRLRSWEFERPPKLGATHAYGGWRVVGQISMKNAIERIVDAYVRLNDRQALEDLIAHRRKLAADLAGRWNYDISVPLRQIDDEIAVIEAGLQRLEAVTLSEWEGKQ
jgi:hypothetical protein